MRWHTSGLAVAIAITPALALAASQDVTVHNRTGYPIQSIYVREVDGTDWGNDVIGRDTLRDGERMDITFDRRTQTCLWNLKVEYRDATQATWTAIDLCKTSDLTLTADHQTNTTVLRGR